MKTIERFSTLLGALVPLVFWSTLAVCASRLGDYNHLSNLVSELGAEGSETRWLFASGLLICSALSVCFVAALIKICREARINTLPVLLILSFSVSIAGAAIFPMPLRLHDLFGLPFVLMLLSPPLAMLLWRHRSDLVGLRFFAVVSMLFMLAGTLVFFPTVLEGFFGLKQRFMHAGWSIWFTYLSWSFWTARRRGRLQ